MIFRYALPPYGHSRGSMIIENTMGALHDDGAADNVFAKTGVDFFGPAASAQQTAERLNRLSQGKQNTVILENHGYDFVGRLIGDNSATDSLIFPDNTALKDMLGLSRM